MTDDGVVWHGMYPTEYDGETNRLIQFLRAHDGHRIEMRGVPFTARCITCTDGQVSDVPQKGESDAASKR